MSTTAPPTPVTFSALYEGELFYRSGGTVLYRKRGSESVMTHAHRNNPAGTSFKVSPTTKVYRPTLSVRDKKVYATHPVDPVVVRYAGPAADTAPDTTPSLPNAVLVSHLPPGAKYFGYGPYGSTDWYRVDASVPGSAHVNVTHLGTGKQLLGNPLSTVQRYAPPEFTPEFTPEADMTESGIKYEAIEAESSRFFQPKAGYRLKGKFTGAEYLVYDPGVAQGLKTESTPRLRLLRMRDGTDAGPIGAEGITHSEYAVIDPPAVTPPTYRPLVNDLVTYKGALYKVTYATPALVDLVGLFGARKTTAAVSDLKKVINATITTTH